MSKANAARRVRGPGPLRLAFTRAVQDWWYGLIPFAIINLMWAGLVVTVVAGPPATAALLVVARDAAIGQGAEPSAFFFALRRYFWRAWALGLVSAVGTFLFVFDLFYYGEQLRGQGVLFNVGVFLPLYMLIVWLEFLLVAWPLLVNQPEMDMRHVLRNAAIVTLRTPGANLGLAVIVLLLTVFSLWLSPFLGLGLAALVSLLTQHYLHLQAPILAHWPPRPGEGHAEPETVSLEKG